jgi:hypothetical protein
MRADHANLSALPYNLDITYFIPIHMYLEEILGLESKRMNEDCRHLTSVGSTARD